MADADPARTELGGVESKPARPKQEKTTPSLWWVLGGAAVPLMRIAARVRVRHPERLPATGPYILAPNHLSNIDPLVVAVTVWRLGRAPRFLAKASLFRVPVIGRLFTAIGQIPVERGGGARAGIPLDAAKRLIRDGQGVIVYPEGSLTRDPALWPMRGKTGAARLALDLGLPVIPVAHWGAQQLMPVNTTKLRLVPRAHIELEFGEPVDLADLYGRPMDGATLQEATDRIMAAVTALLAGLRDEPTPARRWDPAAHGQTETGTF